MIFMSICTKCGAVMHPEDAEKHICDPIDIPQKGIINKPISEKIDLKTSLVVG